MQVFEDYYCGDNVAVLGESCDGLDMGGKTCATWCGGNEPHCGARSAGKLSCKPDCTFDISKCVESKGMMKCGDNVKGTMEICDGDDLNGRTCATWCGGNEPHCGAKSAGILKCNKDCFSFDISGCVAPHSGTGGGGGTGTGGGGGGAASPTGGAGGSGSQTQPSVDGGDPAYTPTSGPSPGMQVAIGVVVVVVLAMGVAFVVKQRMFRAGYAAGVESSAARGARPGTRHMQQLDDVDDNEEEVQLDVIERKESRDVEIAGDELETASL